MGYDEAWKRLKAARIAAEYKTAISFCEKFSIPASTYSLHENGKRNLNTKVAERYAVLLNISPIWLLTGEGNAFNEEKKTLSISNFMKLLKYEGNEKIKAHHHYANEILDHVDPKLFSKIVLSINELIKSLNINLSLDQISNLSVQAYKDILNSSKNEEIRMEMINLYITTLKRQFSEKK